MEYTVTGRVEGRVASLTWTDEDDVLVVSGPDVRLAAALHQMSDLFYGERVGPVGGPYTERNHIEDPLSAFILMHELFDEIIESEGEVPRIPSVPDGASP